ncbi:MAG: PIG-L family deacetylase [Planctomycetes bacterium]|nr:PIG-L family deacetylase [Planctomycetota bacterium]
MTHTFPPLVELSALRKRVLVFAPHPDDEVLGVGGTLALHASRGDQVRVVIVTDGAAGAPEPPRADIARTREAWRADIARTREAESRAAAAELGLSDVRFLGLADGALGADAGLCAKLAAELLEFAPEAVYLPSPFEYHADHRALSAAAASVVAESGASEALFYGVNVPLPGGMLVDITAVRAKKRAALERFTSQRAVLDFVPRAEAADRARALNCELPGVEALEGFARCRARDARAVHARLAATSESLESSAPTFERSAPAVARSAVTAVMTAFNKKAPVLENLRALHAQTVPFARVVVVDNCSSDGTVEAIEAEFPDVTLVRMPHSAYGACETFNIGFSTATTPLVAILDDDVVLPPNWVEKMTARLAREPETTAIVSCEVEEPGMPAGYLEQEHLKRERYMSTFRGCASLARLDALRRAGYYDARLFIYGNERDLTCRLLNLGFRVLQYPEVRALHKTPFGIKMGKRSLYYHARNAWMSMLKYAPAGDLARLPWLVFTRVILRGDKTERAGNVSDATGTIGIGRSLRETPGAWWVVVKAAFGVLANVPYCWKHRQPCHAPDFELPLK